MIRFGIVGAGIMGRRQAKELQEPWFTPYAQVTAVYDRDADRAGAAASELGARACDSLEELFALVDAVYISTPDDAHREAFIAAVESGVAVLVEKPFATTLEDARAMLAACAGARQVVEVNWGNRWYQPFVGMKSALDAGELGPVRAVKAWLSNTTYVPLEMLAWAGRSTSAWFLLSHVFDLTTWLGGARPSRILARGSKDVLVRKGVDTYDYLHALIEYSDGSTGIYESSWILPAGMGRIVDFQYHLMGNEGTASVDLGHQTVEVAGADRTNWLRDVSYSRDRMLSFIQACDGTGFDDSSVRAGFDNTATLVALHESAESGEIVDIASI